MPHFFADISPDTTTLNKYWTTILSTNKKRHLKYGIHHKVGMLASSWPHTLTWFSIAQERISKDPNVALN